MSRIVELREKLGEISDRIDGILRTAETDGRALTDEERTALSEAEKEEKRTADTLAAEERAAERRTRLGAVEMRSDGAAAGTAPREERGGNVEVGETREGAAPWKAFGEYVYALRFNPSDPRLIEQREMSMGTDAEGGFAVPDQFRNELLEFGPDEALIEPRATVIPAGDPPDAKVQIPALDQTGEGRNIYGGVTVEWIDEGGDKPETDAAIRQVELEPHEVAGTLVVTDKLLRNWQAADPLIRRLFRGALLSAREEAYLTGDGSGKPTGMASHASAIEIPRAAADEVSFADVATMFSRVLRRGTRPVWIYNPGVLPQLVQMRANDSGPLIWQPSARDGVPSTLFGLPAFPHEALALPGAAGDIILADLSYYLIKRGSGPFIAASEHVLFRSNKTVFKAFDNVDGKPWTVAPLTISGQTYSPFVTLDVPEE